MTMSNLTWTDERGKKWRDLSASLEAMMAAIDEPLFQSLEIPNPLPLHFKIADVACGAGGTSLYVAQALKSSQEYCLQGFDVSSDLITEAQTRAHQQNLKIDFEVRDVSQGVLPAQAPYDRVFSRFGIMFFEEPQAAFKSLRTWLSPQGRFSFVVWGPRSENPWVGEVNRILAQNIDIPAPEPDAPGPFRYEDPEKLKHLLTEAGFTDISVRKWQCELPIGGGMPPQLAAQFSLSMFSVAQVLSQQPQNIQDQVSLQLQKHYEKIQHQKGSVVSGASVWIFTGRSSDLL